jgi:hypothetical protein
MAVTPATRHAIPSRERLEMESRSRRQLIGYTTSPLMTARAVVDRVLPA